MSNSETDILKSIRARLVKEYDEAEPNASEDRDKWHYLCGVIDGLEKAIDIVDEIGKETI